MFVDRTTVEGESYDVMGMACRLLLIGRRRLPPGVGFLKNSKTYIIEGSVRTTSVSPRFTDQLGGSGLLFLALLGVMGTFTFVTGPGFLTQGISTTAIFPLRPLVSLDRAFSISNPYLFY
jgi:hypothetical protein